MTPARILLEEALALLRLTEDAPLSERIDAGGMAAAAQHRASIRLGADGGLLDWPELRADLDRLLGVPSSSAPDFASWLSAFHARLRPSHPQAFAIALLRLNGLDDAAIAARLGLGARLVRRIRQDVPC
ncbi:MAG: hypothetical protein FD180_402 [Planctomycetota bacterium]|nr:MAG: hypothetical protein FD180_402 [Planctomycetota bacterium]